MTQEMSRLIRKMSPNKGMTKRQKAEQVRISLWRGFEMFGGYETWDDGFIITLYDDAGESIGSVQSSKLDVALVRAQGLYDRWKAGQT